MGISVYKRHVACICFLFFLMCPGQAAWAEEGEEMEILRLFYSEEDLVVSPTRYEKPLSQVAENISVVTAREIQEMNAHTLADVLFHVTGVQIEVLSTPGFPASIHIQGSESRHVLVTIDGIPINNLGENFADIGALPVQNIERVEIIKGPASSSWGSSLGGMVNVITKSPAEETRLTISSSYGERDTGNFRADVSGREGRLGYYLFAGRLESGGLRPNTGVSDNSLYAKLVFDVTEKVSAFLTFGYNEGSRGLSEALPPLLPIPLYFEDEYEYIYATLGMEARVTENGELSLSLRTIGKDIEQITRQIGPGTVLERFDDEEESYGGSLKFVQGYKFNTFVIGSDFESGTLTSNGITGGEQGLDTWAVYANDTLAFKGWSFTPGIRYDHTNTNGDFTSPSLGVTWLPHKSTVLRATVARGFSIPPLISTFGTGATAPPILVPNPDLDVEKVWSYQAGVETNALQYLGLKGTVFRHDVKDAIVREQLSPTSYRAINSDRIRRQGVEVEARTVPFYDVSLSAGYSYMDTEDRKTGKAVDGAPRETWDIGLSYRAERVKGLLEGHYIKWNGIDIQQGKDDTFVWDLNLLGTLRKKDTGNVDVFLTVHNIFNASQYPLIIFKNPRRWVEAGLRITL